MPEPRPWPNNASDARDRAAEAAVEGERLLRKIVDGEEMSEAEKVRRVGKAWGLFGFIARLLESVGAQTRP